MALLQEVPPWWPPPLAAAAARSSARSSPRATGCCRCGAGSRERNPDILKSNGGGANAILVRGEILEHRAERLRRRPEARWVHGVRLAGRLGRQRALAEPSGGAGAGRHAGRDRGAHADWAAAPLVFGGDINLRRPPELPGLVHLGGNHVDHLFSDGRPAAGRREVLDRGHLSDHPPVAVTLA